MANLDFCHVNVAEGKKGQKIVKMDFTIDPREDLMTQGGKFLAVYNEDTGMWTKKMADAALIMDRMLQNYHEEHKQEWADHGSTVLYFNKSSTKQIDEFRHYCEKQLEDQWHPLDTKLTFADTKTTRDDYASKRLKYSLVEGDHSAWDTLTRRLYSPENRHKIEWGIGSIIAGDAAKIQKFFVFYGEGGTGKTTILDIISDLFGGKRARAEDRYWVAFNAKQMGDGTSQFPLESFKDGPLVAIQQDGDLSRIKDNTMLNSMVSHDELPVNTKNKAIYSRSFNCVLFMGTNSPVMITDGKSGLIRRLIDISPTGKLFAPKEYNELLNRIKFEHGAIAYHCKQVYEADPHYYDKYAPTVMMGATNDMYNFVERFYLKFSNQDSTTLLEAWNLYKDYCQEAMVRFVMPQKEFKEELKLYFWDYSERATIDGERKNKYYSRFRRERFTGQDDTVEEKPSEPSKPKLLELNKQVSLLDELYSDCPAQYATTGGGPKAAWDDCTTTLKDIDTSKIHYVRPPENHIVIDFDIPGDDGGKCLEKNLQKAAEWPPTYAELSKSGNGVHLHYIYDGDASTLGYLVEEHVEVKVFTGKSSLRRKLTQCNDIPLAHINSGLPIKEKKVINKTVLDTEAKLEKHILKCCRKGYEPKFTKPNVDYIYNALQEAYESGMTYDLSRLWATVYEFAGSSSNSKEYCLKKFLQMKWRSKNYEEDIPEVPNEAEGEEKPIAIFDIEVFPNLVLIVYGEVDKPPRYLLNPSPKAVEALINFYRLIGFNNIRYDNMILWAIAYDGATPYECYLLSKKIIGGERIPYSYSAKALSYTDIYDLSSKKQSLKKWELETKSKHHELGMDWDLPVPEDKIQEVIDYCLDDVKGTIAVWQLPEIQLDFKARQILAEWAGMTVNDSTNNLTTRLIFGSDKNPQTCFNYRDMGDESQIAIVKDKYTCFDTAMRPIFPGYSFKGGVSTYRGEEVGEGGYVYASPGMYWDVTCFDVASMHPSSIRAEQLFGKYTKNYEDICDLRLHVKHKDLDAARQLFEGKLAKYLDNPEDSKGLSKALKIAINSVYGLTAAKFSNPFRDPRNVDNIVAKRGALFMVNLKHEVEDRGYHVVHIKTDSIKVEHADAEIAKFISEYGKMYGYNFEVEHHFDRICLVNDAVYIGKCAADDPECPNEWTATGTQFAVPYVFKTLFSKEPLTFDDFCEIKSVKSAIYIDVTDGLPVGEHSYRFVGKVGEFTPVLPNRGGGYLVRTQVDKNGQTQYYSVTGTKGYLWRESADIYDRPDAMDYVDIRYYQNLANDARDEIAKYGDFEVFTAED